MDYFFVELGVERHFEALRHFLLMEDGEFAQSLSDLLFEKVRLRNERRTCIHTAIDVLFFFSFLDLNVLGFFLITIELVSFVLSFSGGMRRTLRFTQIRFNPLFLCILTSVEYNLQHAVGPNLAEGDPNVAPFASFCVKVLRARSKEPLGYQAP